RSYAPVWSSRSTTRGLARSSAATDPSTCREAARSRVQSPALRIRVIVLNRPYPTDVGDPVRPPEQAYRSRAADGSARHGSRNKRYSPKWGYIVVVAGRV